VFQRAVSNSPSDQQIKDAPCCRAPLRSWRDKIKEGVDRNMSMPTREIEMKKAWIVVMKL
jgi:hypothetical protein